MSGEQIRANQVIVGLLASLTHGFGTIDVDAGEIVEPEQQHRTTLTPCVATRADSAARFLTFRTRGASSG